jgi:hypothetical protein
MSRRKRGAAARSEATVPAISTPIPAPAGARETRRELLVGVAVGFLAAAVYFSGRLEYSNIDEYNGRAFADGFWKLLAGAISGDLGNGRFRPVYWLLQGALVSSSGSTATILMLGRLAFLGMGASFQYLLSRRLGASRAVAALLTLSLAWSLPALAIWTPGGPAEGFGNPLALAFTYAVVVATSLQGVAAAGVLGLLAALTKESYGAWTAAALLSLALYELLRRRRGPVMLTAAGLGLLQLVPAVIAALGPKQLSSSYLGYVVQAIRGTPEVALRMMVGQLPLALLLGAAGLVAIAARLLRTGPRAWPCEDLIVLAVLGAALTEVFALGLTLPRYHIPVGTGLCLVAARGAARLGERGVSRRLALAVQVALALLVLPGGARAVLAARSAAGDRRVDARLRVQIGDALRQYGAVRIYWHPNQVEQPVGALSHLKRDGITGDVELRPCLRPNPAEAAALNAIFAPYATPLTKPAPTLVNTLCPRVGPGPVTERACWLVLPGLRYGATFDCHEKREHTRTYAVQ